MPVLIDLCFWNHDQFEELAAAGIAFLSRVKQNCCCRVVAVVRESATVREKRIYLGHAAHPSAPPMRLVELRVGEHWAR